MKHAFLLLAVLSTCGLVRGQGVPGAVLHKLGEVDVRSLPPADHGRGPLYSHAILLPDSELFQQEKLQAQGSRGGKGGGGGGGGGMPGSNVVLTNEGLTSVFSFDGLALSDTAGYVPPDTQVAAGISGGALALVEMVNNTIRVTDGSGHLQAEGDMCGLFYCDFFTAVISDPIVRYDPAGSGHWFASVVTIEYVIQGALLKLEGQWRLAVSQTSDPTGLWNVYGVTMSNGTFPDFPKMGLSADKVVQTGDAFTISTNRYKGTEFGVLNKADVIAGVQTPGFQYFAPDQGMFAIESVQTAGEPLYMAAVGSSKNSSSAMRVWKLTGTPNTSGSGVTVATTDVPVALFVTPPNAPQAGSTTLIDTNGDWLVGGAYDDSTNKLWVSAESACIPDGDTATRSCLRFVQLDLSGANPTLLQDLTFGVVGEYLYYPAVAFDQNGNLITVYNESSDSEYVGVNAGGQTTGSSGTLQMQAPVLLKAGEAAYNISPPRWGDYSGASVDAETGSPDVWLGGEYAQAANGGQWGTWIASVYFQ
jgi:hypothetical protein